jgi:hypothetical protein
MTFSAPSTPAPLAPLPAAPTPPPTMFAGAAPGAKPQPKAPAATFLSDAMGTNPTNTGQKKLTGE